VDQFSRVEQVFLAALDKAVPAERTAYLDQVCADNAKLRQHLERLLAAHRRARDTLVNAPSSPKENAPADGLNRKSARGTQENSGARIGPYRLLHLLGEGGMGTVYLAEQDEPVKRRVALKIIKAGMDSAKVIARFEQERQALAMMDHPNIAKVLDAGTTETGRLFFVMELVKGIPITRYCDQEHLSPRQRLELFLPVCQAVQHAHQKGIIHRDLKPSNVLVALYDGKAVPKVIDFGVAKATHHKLTDRTMFTEAGSIVGTLEYMAPEQAELNNLDIDTRADIYSLGVLLYELLTGSTPFTAAQLRGAAYDEMLRMIREVEPPKPSVKLSSSHELPAIAASRKLEPRRLTSLVSGELDWIVMKALDKDRGRRYETANALAMDLRRYLADEPVLASPPSASYRLKKFLRRNKASVATLVAIMIVLTAGVIGTTWGLLQAREAKRLAQAEATKSEAARARARAALDEVSSEAMETLLSQQPVLTDRHKAFLRRALELFSELAEDTGTDPESQADIARALVRMGNIRTSLGELTEAERAYTRAAQIFTSLVQEFPKQTAYAGDLARLHDAFGKLLHRIAKRAEAEERFRMGRELLEKLHKLHPESAEHQADLAKACSNLANALADRAERDEAEAGYRRAIDLLQTVATTDDREVRSRLANAHYNLAILLNEMGRDDESVTEYRTAIQVHQALVRDFPQWHDYVRRLSNCLINLSHLLAQTEAEEEAEQLLLRGLEIQEKLTRDFPSIPEYKKYLARTLSTLASFYADQDKSEQARATYQRTVQVRQRLVETYPEFPDYLRDLGSIYNNFAFFEFRSGNLAAAVDKFRQALKIQEPLVHKHSTIPEYRKELGNTYGNLGVVLLRQEDFAEAEQAFRKVLEHNEVLMEQLPGEPEYLLRKGGDEGNIAEALAAQGKKEEALDWLDRSLAHMREAADELPRGNARASTWLFNTTSNRATLLEQLGRFDEAIRDWDAVLELATAEQQSRVRLKRALSLAQSGEPEEAVAEVNTVMNDSGPDSAHPLLAARIFARAASASPTAKDEYATRSLDLLRSARQSGAFDSDEELKSLKEDPHLEPLRSRLDFQAWLKELELNRQ
jgi:serine/threonine protein kinase/Tfp pilus assembly protein PilF